LSGAGVSDIAAPAESLAVVEMISATGAVEEGTSDPSTRTKSSSDVVVVFVVVGIFILEIVMDMCTGSLCAVQSAVKIETGTERGLRAYGFMYPACVLVGSRKDLKRLLSVCSLLCLLLCLSPSVLSSHRQSSLTVRKSFSFSSFLPSSLSFFSFLLLFPPPPPPSPPADRGRSHSL
jgi:hypothetical protein